MVRAATVTVSATDDGEVLRVILYVDGVASHTDTEPPYEFPLDTTLMNDGTHLLRATGEDATGNVGESQTVSVNVDNITNPGPDGERPPTIVVNGGGFSALEVAVNQAQPGDCARSTGKPIFRGENAASV